jgi:DNA polymerase-3 subunit gamma/tau
MPSQALYRKWRPQLWDEVVGQEHVVQTLRHALQSDHIAHAYLFAGPRGCGKTTTARLVAKALNCLNPDPAQRPDNTCAHCVAVNEGRFLDLIEIDGASNNGVENIRELRDKINFSPSEGRYKVYIVDEVHMLSAPAFNAMLKTLEEPPPHAIFILATTESHKIPATVTSRCQRFEFRRIPVVEIVARLKRLCVQERLSADDGALEVVARQATGSLRDAISLLDQLVGAADRVTLAQAQELLGTSTAQAVTALVEALADVDLPGGMRLVNAAVDAGADPRQLARQVVDHLRNLMLVRSGNAALVEAGAEVRAAMARQAQRLDVSALLHAIRAFNTAANDARGGWQPQLPLELAVVECTSPPAEAAAAGSPAVDHATATEPAVLAAPKPPRAAHAAPALAPTPVGPDSPPFAGSARPVPGGAGRGLVPRPLEASTDGADVGRTTQVGEASTRAGTTRGTAELRTDWNRIVGMIRERDKATEALLRSCQVIGLEGNILQLSSNEFVLNKIDGNPATRELIESTLTEVLGFACAVKLEVTGRKVHSARTGDHPDDGLVATALDLGGEIVE